MQLPQPMTRVRLSSEPQRPREPSVSARIKLLLCGSNSTAPAGLAPSRAQSRPVPSKSEINQNQVNQVQGSIGSGSIKTTSIKSGEELRPVQSRPGIGSDQFHQDQGSIKNSPIRIGNQLRPAQSRSGIDPDQAHKTARVPLFEQDRMVGHKNTDPTLPRIQI